ncbi:2-dehydro-3-deoxygluconokinase [Streptoalloteichus tenebrarius]|uniref:2-dehydro-3-deoxygluconokinase n=1 Tax=Streptoalloteichus tenebrarius (strain ATCC 17920 / DSM 40477 / JCM 4838 / CBS 697.72 / NBRC 16177 / NCIMB 11028 / NRRL B-12390 / A12253. 1 / ISP 5477) TaxID=1933 RepID=A0ABT1HSF7_STRSD|nr:sugar kinase [Streptoalloteichus tenebrarius]MCP2258467.1 2-dehydro-3-deoxygluconokinase [Streptoalloteichus tenebrarius]BFF03639.1 sugar kinase [Streptoalloteichus tenebrarius]
MGQSGVDGNRVDPRERGRDRRADVVCLGESLAVFVPDGHQARRYLLTVGGAESNVACHLARAGLPVRWVGAVGADDLGEAVLAHLRSFGVDVTDVRIDPERPTGLYVKEPHADGSRMRYYRRGSAASALGPDLLAALDLSATRLVHLTGITAALSPSCHALSRAALAPRSGGHLVSFDVNWRPVLWRDQDARVLTELANAADVVFVGEDEAEALWGTGDPERVRELLPAPTTLVVKQGARGATLVEGDALVFQPALAVDVVEPVGAGDAFAAGFLAATLAGAEPTRRLRAGHLLAAATLCSHEDVAEPLPADLVADLLAADETTWAAARVTREGVTGR